ncbi:glycosyltransferase family 2 protein [Leptothermofonsia sp. ETS-13]|uniref:glycosyltransferase family 2 protein n=1 Tax=Leptothermofonsia sp. ETS-13 TaxID=3035696 RepID=UPI003BA1C900
MTLANEPLVTIVVVPRERFSCAQRSLESIYEHTTLPFKLVYVDGNAPFKVQQYLKAQAEEKSFHLIRTDYYLYPNQARNLGLTHANTRYVVFVDNDVIVSPGWLEALVQCAEETQAAVVGPLMCQHEPLHTEVHFAGGESHVWVDSTGRRRLREKMYQQGQKVAELRPRLQRQETELAEFHCVLVRREVFDRLGFLDEQLFNTKEHLDFCMSVRQMGGTVYFEPDCVVTYVPGPPLELSDLHYYMLRWSDAWTLGSLHRLRDKWNLAEDGYFQSKYKKLGWRRYGTIIEPFVRWLTFGAGNRFLTRAFAKVEHYLNRFLTDRHIRIQQQVRQQGFS